jgi:hypothetical protein
MLEAIRGDVFCHRSELIIRQHGKPFGCRVYFNVVHSDCFSFHWLIFWLLYVRVTQQLDSSSR